MEQVMGLISEAGIIIVLIIILIFLVFKMISYAKNKNIMIAKLEEKDKTLVQKNHELQSVKEEVRRNELLFRTLFYHSGDASFLLVKDEIADVNAVAMEMLGFKEKQDLIGKSIYLLMPDIQNTEKKSKDYLEDVLHQSEDGKAIKTEITLLTKSEIELFLEAVFIEVEMMERKYLYLSARDSKENKKQESEMLFYAQHDALTKVANRQFYNEKIKQITEVESNYPIAFMMIDVNGLKLANDFFGHSKGDELLVTIANVLSRSCRNHDLVARVGGDEFVIIFPNANEKAVQAVMERIRKNLSSEKIETLSPSISIGYAVKEHKEEDTESVLKLADDMMYKSKSSGRQDNARQFLENIVEYLFKKHPEDKKQVETLLQMLNKLGEESAYRVSHKREIEKLIYFLNLGKLVSQEEDWKMEGNTLLSLHFSQKLIENSYAVLKKIGEIKSCHIAEYLVSINEHWDGSGFALATSGEEIPYVVRVFKILFDIYYIKHHLEVYEKMDREELKRKLLALSGKRYDPELAPKFFEILL